MKSNPILRKLEIIYRRLTIRTPYPQVLWNEIFRIPETDDLIDEFIERATKADIKVEKIDGVDELKKRIGQIFESFEKVWIDNELRQSRLFNHFPIVVNHWEANAGITVCRALIARTGSIVVDSSQGRQAGLIAPNHFVIASKKQIYPDLSNYFEEISQSDKTPSSISIITGPSRTADIEKKLVKGAHGPASVTVLLVL